MLVLIVEDDPLIALDLEEIIVAHAGARVTAVTSIESAMQVLPTALDFAFLDVELRGGNSIGFAAELRQRKVPFAFVTGSPRERLPDDLRDVPFVGKPFSPQDITRAFEARNHTLSTAGNLTANRVVPFRVPASIWPLSRPARA